MNRFIFNKYLSRQREKECKLLRELFYSFHFFFVTFCLIKVTQIMQSSLVERDNVRLSITLTTIAFATTVDLRSQNRRPGVSPYPAGIAVDSTRAVPEGLFLLHDSRKSCVLSRKLCIVFGLRDSHASRGRTSLSYFIVENAL